MVIRRKYRPKSVIITSVFTAFAFAGFAIYVWNVPSFAIVKAILVLIAIMLAMIIPAAIFVLIVKGVKRGVQGTIRHFRHSNE